MRNDRSLRQPANRLCRFVSLILLLGIGSITISMIRAVLWTPHAKYDSSSYSVPGIGWIWMDGGDFACAFVEIDTLATYSPNGMEATWAQYLRNISAGLGSPKTLPYWVQYRGPVEAAIKPPDKVVQRWRVEAFGFPFRSVSRSQELNVYFKTSTWLDGWKLSINGQSIVVPNHVIWRGTLGNAFAYMGFVFGLTRTVRRLSHALRRVRGACSKCGYSLSGIPGDAAKCPECGSDLLRPLQRETSSRFRRRQ
jgi:ribosomal protein L40E